MEWTDLYDQYSEEKPEGDDVSAEHINRIAHAVIDAEGKIEDLEEAVGDVYTKSQVYTKTEIDDTVSELQGDIDSKALAADVYTKDKTYTQQDAVRKFSYLEAALGNSIQIKDTIAAILAEMELRGETTVRRVVFSGGNLVDIIGGTWPFSNGASLTFTGLDSAVSANNKTVTVTTVSGSRMAFPASSFTNGVSLNGTVTDGTTTIYIAVSPDHPQTLDSLHSFDLHNCAKNFINSDVSVWESGTYSSTVGSATTKEASTKAIRLKDLKGIKVDQLKTYALSSATFGTYRIGWGITDKDGILLSWSGTVVANAVITMPKDAAYFIPRITRVDGADITPSQVSNVIVMLEPGSVATAHEPYVGKKVSLDLKDTSGNPLYAHGIPLTYNLDGSVASKSTEDVVFKDVDGKWKLRPYTGEYTLLGSDIATLSTSPTNVDRVSTTTSFIPLAYKADWISSSERKNVIMSGSTEKAFADSINNIGTFYTNSAGYITFVVAKGTTLEAARTLLAGIKLKYKLATPGTPIELHADCQTALNQIAYSYDGTTNIMLSTPYGQVYAEAAKNITKVIDDIKAAIALLG